MGSDTRIVEEARRRQAFFKDLPRYLEIIKNVIRNKLDPEAQVYLFGSVAEGTNVFASDIDILVVSDVRPERVRVALSDEGIGDPFEVLVITKQKLDTFRRRAKLVPV